MRSGFDSRQVHTFKMKIETKTVEDIPIFRLNGDLDTDSLDDFRGVLNSHRDSHSNQRNIVINLTGIKFMSYLNVGELTNQQKAYRQNGGEIKLVGLTPYTKNLLNMVGVINLFNIYQSESEAVESYKNPRSN